MAGEISFEFEDKARAEGYSFICGIDEAGRGPLAGSVYAAAVILPQKIIEGINDSKKLSEKKRDRLYDIIKAEAIDYAVCTASPAEIDENNILNATFLAMGRCVQALKKVDFALVDGNRIKGLTVPSLCVVKGDSKSFSIAAASILAKVERDRYMYSLHEKYPEYDFASHKGYPTRKHYEMVEKYGLIPEIHRKTFFKNRGL